LEVQAASVFRNNLLKMEVPYISKMTVTPPTPTKCNNPRTDLTLAVNLFEHLKPVFLITFYIL
jgi:hypothetical protein